MNVARDRTPTGLIILALMVLALAPYVQTLHHDFVNFDDNLYVTDQRVVQDGLTRVGFAWAFTTTEGGNWHPITWLSHMLDCTIFGMRAGGHHLVSALIHAVNTLLLWLVLHRMSGAGWRSGLAAALFAVHPLHVESVAWVAERKDVLSAMFGLLAIWSYIGYVRRGGALRYVLVIIWMALSLMCKPMLVTLPFVLLLLDVWPLRRLNASNTQCPVSLTRLLLEKAPLLAMSVVFSVVAMIAQRASHTMSSFESLSLTSRIVNAVVAYGTYLFRLAAPFDLAVYYPHPGRWEPWRVWLCAGTLTVITLLAALSFPRRPWVLVGWMWFVGMLVPVIGLVQVGMQAYADRYAYLPAIGVFIAVSWSIPATTREPVRRTWVTASVAVVLGFVIVSVVQTMHWSVSRTLFDHALKVTSNNFMAHQNLGLALQQAGDTDKAISHYRSAIDIRPQYGLVHENLANALYQKGAAALRNRDESGAKRFFSEVVTELNSAIALDPRSFSAHNSMGVLMMALKRHDEAEAALAHAVSLEPRNPETRANHALALLELKRWDEAIVQLDIVARTIPSRLDVRIQLARTLAKVGRIDDARRELQEVLKINPRFAPAHAALRELMHGGAQTRPHE